MFTPSSFSSDQSFSSSKSGTDNYFIQKSLVIRDSFEGVVLWNSDVSLDLSSECCRELNDTNYERCMQTENNYLSDRSCSSSGGVYGISSEEGTAFFQSWADDSSAKGIWVNI